MSFVVFLISCQGAPLLRHAVFAGGTGAGYGGDGGRATEAGFDRPTGMALDSQGNLYIADSNNNAIRRVDQQGVVITIAGIGKKGFKGDGGLASKALLAGPEGICVSRSGATMIYVADTLNCRIRRIDGNGKITTVAGNGSAGFSGDGGPALSARLCYPEDVAVDNQGNIYIADTRNHRIRLVDQTGMITTIAGNGQPGSTGDGGPAVVASVEWPRGLAIARSGELYVTADKMVRRIDLDRRIQTVAGGGDSVDVNGIRATTAYLGILGKIALEKNGDLLIVDNNKRRFLRLSGDRLFVLFKDHGGAYYPPKRGDNTQVTLAFPIGIAVDDRGIFVSDERLCQVVLFSPDR